MSEKENVFDFSNDDFDYDKLNKRRFEIAVATNSLIWGDKTKTQLSPDAKFVLDGVIEMCEGTRLTLDNDWNMAPNVIDMLDEMSMFLRKIANHSVVVKDD